MMVFVGSWGQVDVIDSEFAAIFEGDAINFQLLRMAHAGAIEQQPPSFRRLT